MPDLDYLDLARHTTTSTGTGPLTLMQVDGYPPPRLDPAKSYSYAIIDPVHRAFETGIAPAAAAHILDRAAGTISLSSASNTTIDLQPGTKSVVFGPLAATIRNIDDALSLAQQALVTAEAAALAASVAQSVATTAADSANTANTLASAASTTAQAAAAEATQASNAANAASASADTAQTTAQDALAQLALKANANEVVQSLGGVSGPLGLNPTGGIAASVANGQLNIDGSAVVGAVWHVNGQTGPVTLPIPTLPLAMSDVAGLEAALAAPRDDLTLSPLRTGSVLGTVGQLEQFDLGDLTSDAVYTLPTTLAPNDRWGLVVVREHATLGYAVVFDANGHFPLVTGSLTEYLLRTGDLLFFRAIEHPTHGIAVLIENARLGTKPPLIQYIDSSDPGFTPAIPLTLQTGGGGYGNTVYFSNVAGGALHGTWTCPNCRPGTYRLSASWFGDGNRTTSARYVISGPGSITVTAVNINQQLTPTDLLQNGGAFKHLTSSFILQAAGAITIHVNNDAPGYLLCDALRIERLG